jgi:ATP-binding cassette subfamily A (ABC1) protein 3
MQITINDPHGTPTMTFRRQITTLTWKNLLIFRRRYISSFFRALLLPVAIFIALGYIKYLFGSPGLWGNGKPTPIRTFEEALTHHEGRDTFAFVDGGFAGGEIDNLINNISTTVRVAGLRTVVVHNEGELSNVCKGNLNGATRCWAGINFLSSPGEPICEPSCTTM